MQWAQWSLVCGSRKYTHTYSKEGYWNILVGRESQGPKVSKESINQNSNLQRDTGEGGEGGGGNEKPSMGEYGYLHFLEHTHLSL